jgi:hypothetical protein
MMVDQFICSVYKFTRIHVGRFIFNCQHLSWITKYAITVNHIQYHWLELQLFYWLHNTPINSACITFFFIIINCRGRGVRAGLCEKSSVNWHSILIIVGFWNGRQILNLYRNKIYPWLFYLITCCLVCVDVLLVEYCIMINVGITTG